MATIDTRPFSGEYSGLRNQTVLALGIGSICLTSFELMRRKRRKTIAHLRALKNGRGAELGEVESWEWGYLYQGRCWSKRPSPPLPKWPLAWVKQMILFPEQKLLSLIGPDSTVYARFLRGAFYFTLLHSLTTLPILLPIHVVYAPEDVSEKSMTRASLSSLVRSDKGRRLLVIHLLLLAWLALTWIANLIWLCRGAFRYRLEAIKQAADEVNAIDWEKVRVFRDEGRDGEAREGQAKNQGWRLRSVMVSNIPPNLRDNKTLKEYFEFYMSQAMREPPPAPGLVQDVVSFISRFIQARSIAREVKALNATAPGADVEALPYAETPAAKEAKFEPPVIDKVVIVRKMTELASLRERRELVLRRLEEAHVKLARKVLTAVVEWQRMLDKRKPNGNCSREGKSFLDKVTSRRTQVRKSLVGKNLADQIKGVKSSDTADGHATVSADHDVESQPRDSVEETPDDEAIRMNLLVQAMLPFIEEFGLYTQVRKVGGQVVDIPEPKWKGLTATSWVRHKFGQVQRHVRAGSSDSNTTDDHSPNATYPPRSPETPNDHGVMSDPRYDGPEEERPSIWEVLHALPRDHLDAFQPLIRLSSLFRGAIVPAIDYHTAKLGLLTALINENRSRSPEEFLPASTAFVTFASPADARRAVKILPSHPKNPLICLVEPAPEIGDMDWSRLMTSRFTGEFLKDWVVNLGVWAFTCFWIIPVSLLVSLVSIGNLSIYLPWLKRYLERNPFHAEILSTLIPTLLVTLLAILIPLLLLLLAKKAHTIVLLSKLHDQIMTRYHKFLVCNVLIFFCVGVSATQAFLTSFRQPQNPLPVVAEKFPEAGPFYAGWLIFQTAMHAGLELGLLGLPVLVYPATVRAAGCPRRRKAGTRPRTFNFYYWLPNHLVVLFVTFVFSILNPLVIPFACLYFSVALVVFKHQFLHVYSKAYECNANIILIRMVRYSLDGIALSNFVFFALMVILKESILAGFSGLFMGLTILFKIFMTRYCKEKFEQASITEAEAFCGSMEGGARPQTPPPVEESAPPSADVSRVASLRETPSRRRFTFGSPSTVRFWTWKLPGKGVNFAYSTLPARPRPTRRQPNPFAPSGDGHSQEELVQSEEGEPSDQRPSSLFIPTADITSSRVVSSAFSDPFNQSPIEDVHEKPQGTRRSSLLDVFATRRHDLVGPHESVQLWDDHPRHDQTYDNPHYTRHVDNVLWLPKNPMGVLDLDETIDLFRAITSEPGAGQLGQWFNESASILPETQSTGGQMLTPDHADEGGYESSGRALFGNENISMSSVLAGRVDKEHDVDTAGTDGGSTSNFLRRRPTLTSRRSAFSLHQTPQPGRSFSGGTIPRVPSRRFSSGSAFSPMSPQARTERLLSAQTQATRRTSSVIADPSLRPDLFSQTAFADPHMSIILRSNSQIDGNESRHSQLNQFGVIGRPRAGTGVSVTTREAVLGEVLAEEQIATADRMRREQAETEQASTRRSWLTSWMYSFASHQDL